MGYIKRQKKKDWIQQETLNAMEERRNVKKRLLQTKSSRMRERQEVLYKEIHKKVKWLALRDKRFAVHQLSLETETAASKGEQGRI